MLWTKLSLSNNTSGILVWYVSKHDNVSGDLRRIEKSQERLAAKFNIVSTGSVDGNEEYALNLDAEDILIDPFSNTPLHLYKSSVDEMVDCCDKKLSGNLDMLSAEQKALNAVSGTLLVIGRSGTGKTIYISRRMLQDARRNVQSFRQLFVCRNKELCHQFKSEFCKQEDASHLINVDFMTNKAFLAYIDSTLHTMGEVRNSRFADLSLKVDYRVFLVSIWPQFQDMTDLCPSVVWLHIKSYIKGSVEAVLNHGPIDEATYTDINVFGQERCRLSTEDRAIVYALYTLYQDYLVSNKLWDECDFVLDLLKRSKLQHMSTHFDKVYVDEVQDNTQAEIVLFILAAGMNPQGLVLAGDPAQSVEEGVEFRFEEVRSVVYLLSNAKIFPPQTLSKVVTLTKNRRTHSGILTLANSFLDIMMSYFPGSARVIRDTSMFRGPLPLCGFINGIEELSKILQNNQRYKVICDDDYVGPLQQALTSYQVKNIVIGIRSAKGREFSEVVLVDFFSHIPNDDYKMWKQFISNHATNMSGYPHVEMQLKLLNTAITRSCNRLVLLETKQSELALRMFRWMTVDKKVAEKYSASKHATAVVLMSSDEWRVEGIEFAIMAADESQDRLSNLKMARHCFDMAVDVSLMNRIDTEMHLLQQIDQYRHGSDILCDSEMAMLCKLICGGLNQRLFREVLELCNVIVGKVQFPDVFWFEVLRLCSFKCIKL